MREDLTPAPGGVGHVGESEVVPHLRGDVRVRAPAVAEPWEGVGAMGRPGREGRTENSAVRCEMCGTPGSPPSPPMPDALTSTRI